MNTDENNVTSQVITGWQDENGNALSVYDKLAHQKIKQTDEIVEDIQEDIEELNDKIDQIGPDIADPYQTKIYTQENAEAGGIDTTNTIVITDGSEMSAQAQQSEVYISDGNQTYFDVLFKAIRELQKEVSKLKNTFNYGIQSETGTSTAMSKVISEEEEESEPLWAFDETELTPIDNDVYQITIDENHTLKPTENVEVHSSSLDIIGSASWEDTNETLPDEVKDATKLFMFMTTSSLDIELHVQNSDDETDTYVIDLSNYKYRDANRFNITLCFGKPTETDDELHGNGFIWISIGDYITGESISTGYWDKVTDKLVIGLTTNSKFDKYSYLPKEIVFTDLSLYKCNFYTKQNDLTSDVNYIDVTVPTTDNFVYTAAHITIRGCQNYNEILSIKDQLLDKELIFDETTNKLYIKHKSRIIQISGDSEKHDDTGMTTTELIELLERNGIINISEDGGNDITLNNIGDITFVHQATGKKFKFEVDESGKLNSTQLMDFSDEDKARIESIFSNSSSLTNLRGFIGSLGNKRASESASDYNKTSDLKLNADRLKIGAVYAPSEGRTTFGCTHGYIELENTSDRDIPLSNFYMNYAYNLPEDATDVYHVESLKLSGYIPAGGTYLIRCKQYADKEQSNVNIVVDSFDIEWYDSNNELLDTTWRAGCNHTYMLTYGLPENFGASTVMIGQTTINNTTYRSYSPYYVDTISINNFVNTQNTSTWYDVKWQLFNVIPQLPNGSYRDVIFRNIFELDPAKQAFQGLGCSITGTNRAADKVFDSSRARHDKATDYQYLVIENAEIEFPKSNDSYPISRFTPKASFQHKNVCTDKSQLDLEKPNMVTVSFGINIHKTRCFNWISGGLFDEYVWIRKVGETEWKKFESYHDSLINQNESWAPTAGSTYPYRKSFGSYQNSNGTYSSIESVIYDRITNVFPGCNIVYTSHKCVIELSENAPADPTEWEYIVGRSDAHGNPDTDHCSEKQTFTVYPDTYTPRIFQTTDQQGFHWIEYQPWAAAANEINKTINEQLQTEQIIPILINTGDMTQNGTRINEWLDYYNGGKNLFNHLEQMNVVGNNDLCDTDPTILGTGDDSGKSNGYYFHVFYCYEIDTDQALTPPIINDKYVPSFYYFGNDTYSIIMFNSELTVVNCKNWFNKTKNDQTVNLYTGWTIKDASHNNVEYDSSFTSVYTMLYQMLNKLSSHHIIFACHEMPFTVITNANLTLAKQIKDVDRSLSGSNTGSLVGSHCNVMNSFDSAGKGIYWLSRLLEYYKVKLVIGGHKHTYAYTNPLRELYAYTEDNTTKYSLTDGPMDMPVTLETDTANFNLYYKTSYNAETDIANALSTESAEGYEEIHSSKFPIMTQLDQEVGINDNNIVVFPYFGVSSTRFNSYSGVVYAMCQATGYKLKSNKELPSANQKFSYIIPQTTNAETGDKPNVNQQYAMFTEIDITTVEAANVSESTYELYLHRILHITKTGEGSGTSKAVDFGQYAYSTQDCSYQYLIHEAEDGADIMYGKWTTEKDPLMTITDEITLNN